MSELLPCPFCGNPPDEHPQDVGMNEFTIWCQPCCCEGPRASTKEKAVIAWNTRAIPLAKQVVDDEDRHAVLRAFRWMRIYEEDNKVFGDDVVGKAEAAFERFTSALTRSAGEGQAGSSGDVPEGYKIVPIEPTVEMSKAAAETIGQMTYADVYKAMLAAAPPAIRKIKS